MARAAWLLGRMTKLRVALGCVELIVLKCNSQFVQRGAKRSLHALRAWRRTHPSGVRTKRSSLSICRKRAMAWLMAGWVIPSLCPARVEGRSCMIALNTRSRSDPMTFRSWAQLSLRSWCGVFRSIDDRRGQARSCSSSLGSMQKSSLVGSSVVSMAVSSTPTDASARSRAARTLSSTSVTSACPESIAVRAHVSRHNGVIIS